MTNKNLLRKIISKIIDEEREHTVNVVGCHPFDTPVPISLEEYIKLTGEKTE